MGLSREEINEMPLYKVMMYYHCINVLEGTNTRWEYFDSSIKKADINVINDFIKEI